jgi:hypothetical protein
LLFFVKYISELFNFIKHYAKDATAYDKDEQYSDDEDFGPALPSAPDKEYLKAVNVYRGPNLTTDPSHGIPIGADADSFPNSKFNMSRTSSGGRTEPKAREEWMLTPGENKSVADLYAATGQMSNRKFQTGKGAKKMADMYSAQSSAINKQMAETSDKRKHSLDSPCPDDSLGGIPADVERQPSLMELHLQKKGKTLDSGSSNRRNERESEAVNEMFSFDRERVRDDLVCINDIIM